MAYAHINNLYKDQDILLFKECFAMEKIHGTSAHVSWDGDSVKFFSGGASHKRFVEIFDNDKLTKLFNELIGKSKCIVYGEAYGGNVQKMSHVYGKELKFIAFDVKYGLYLCDY